MAGACRHIDSAGPGIGGVRLRGWAWDRRAKRAPVRILVVDRDGRVRGLGVTGLRRPDIADQRRNRRMRTAGWEGYAGGRRDGGMSAYAILRDGRAACPLKG
jgi:hypothetical protein